MTDRTKTVRVVISGRVQGVWYRSWTVQEAEKRGLDGWVRNRTDGTVEAVFHGPAQAVDEMLGVCFDGPPAADVSNVTAVPCEQPVGPGFRQIATV